MKYRLRNHCSIAITALLSLLICASTLLDISCAQSAKKPAEPPSQPSSIHAVVNPGGPVVLTTSTAEFQVLPSGYLEAFLVKQDGQKLSLDEVEPGKPADRNFLMAGGKPISFVLDFGQTKVDEALGKMGRGKRIEIPARRLAPSGSDLEATVVVEVYDNFPNIALTTVDYKNTGNQKIKIDQAVSQRHRFTSH